MITKPFEFSYFCRHNHYVLLRAGYALLYYRFPLTTFSLHFPPLLGLSRRAPILFHAVQQPLLWTVYIIILPCECINNQQEIAFFCFKHASLIFDQPLRVSVMDSVRGRYWGGRNAWGEDIRVSGCGLVLPSCPPLASRY